VAPSHWLVRNGVLSLVEYLLNPMNDDDDDDEWAI
jgi:hypothetical protein